VRYNGVVAGNFRGRGRADIVVSDIEKGGLALFPVQSDGTLGVPIETPGFPRFWVSTGDFNGDGVDDVLLAPDVFLGTADGHFAKSEGNIPDNGYAACATADLNRDGKSDLACADEGHLFVYLGRPDGTFDDPREVQTGTWAVQVFAGDFNGDGITDLAVSGEQNVILMGRGDGTFSGPGGTIQRAYHLIAAADFNMDGMSDLLAWSDLGELSVLAGRRDGNFDAGPPASLLPLSEMLGVADFDGDGVPDVVMNRGGELVILRGFGDRLGAAERLTDVAVGLGTAIADVDGDGRPDIVTTSLAGNEVIVFRNRGH
jgi:hypothetical protein